ncbi:MAG: DASS family sodium-coupled anion symporter [Steroidobacteraceae bacterium]|jgi:sodium-dependent dicarboxylate transporter 2/3/5|nr:DASS family sodium-coupled anion symporter [Steroidobacteraceae bacterium]
MSQDSAAGGRQPDFIARTGLWVGLLAAGLILLLPPPEGLTAPAWRTFAVMVLMVTWWVCEAIPIPATALTPLLLFPLLGIMPIGETALSYSDPVIYLFIGGFLIALSFERWRLHARLALLVASRLGAQPAMLLGAFMLSAILLSMWISNTATTLMLIPIAMGVARGVYPAGELQTKFASALALGVAYAATIGGVGTPVGSPPNLIAIAFLERQGVHVSFLGWMAVATPVMLLLAPLAWWTLARTLPRAHGDHDAARRVLASELRALGPISNAERRLIIVFILVASAWVLRGWLNTLPGLDGLTDTGVAMAGALALFLLPSGNLASPRTKLADWSLGAKLPWGVVLLYGGGLAIAAAMESTGLAAWIGTVLGFLGSWPALLVIVVMAAITVWASELMSNTATITSLLPVIGAVTVATGFDPRYLMLPMAIAASFGFMLPVSTPPNSIAYATGLVPQRQMLSAGWRLNLYSIFIAALLGYLLVPHVIQ